MTSLGSLNKRVGAPVTGLAKRKQVVEGVSQPEIVEPTKRHDVMYVPADASTCATPPVVPSASLSFLRHPVCPALRVGSFAFMLRMKRSNTFGIAADTSAKSRTCFAGGTFKSYPASFANVSYRRFGCHSTRRVLTSRRTIFASAMLRSRRVTFERDAASFAIKKHGGGMGR